MKRKPGIKWSPEEDAILTRRVNAGDSYKAIQDEIPQRTTQSISNRAHMLGLEYLHKHLHGINQPNRRKEPFLPVEKPSKATGVWVHADGSTVKYGSLNIQERAKPPFTGARA